MRKIIYNLSVAALIVGSSAGYSQNTNTTLAFYVVSEQKTEGGRFIDTPELPKVGYIAATAELTVTNLQEVCPQKMANYAIMQDKDGKQTVVPTHPPFALAVTLGPEDARRFTALTGRSVGKRLLVMLGDKPLTAPTVKAPIEGGAFLIELRDQAKLKKTEDELKKLVR